MKHSFPEAYSIPEDNALLDVPVRVETGLDSPIPGVLNAAPFRLGMPHMTATGLSTNWLLRECCHRHWWDIASRADTVPSEIRDIHGTRVLPSVICASITGDPADFVEDDIVEIQSVVRPRADTGWRSEALITSRSDGLLVVELVTRFVTRAGDGNQTLVPAEMPEPFQTPAPGPDARRAELLRAAGRSTVADVQENTRPPHLSFDVCSETHYNGVGLMYFANFLDSFAKAERNALPPKVVEMPMASREINYFGNIDAGDMLDVITDLKIMRLGESSRIQTVSAATRRSDGKVIAVCRSTRET